MTSLFGLVKKELEPVRTEVLVTTAVSGLGNAAVLAIINQASRRSTSSDLDLRFLLMFIVAMILYIMCQRFSSKQMIRITAELVQKIRIRLTEKIQNSELPVLEKIGKGDIINAMTQETTIIAVSGDAMTSLFQASIFVFFAALYIAYLSMAAFLLTVVFAGIAIAIVQSNRTLSRKLIGQTREKEVEFLNYVTHALEGFKETRLNDQRRAHLQEDLQKSSIEAMHFRQQVEDLQSRNSIFAQCSFYVLLGAVVFILPTVSQTYSQVVTEITMAILFIVGPLTLIVSILPYFGKCNEAAKAVFRVEEALDAGHEAAKARGELTMPPVPRPFKSIELYDVRFSYKSELNDVFTLGPISLTIEPAEIIFFVGGNGSGKSTLLKVITGLYPPDGGNIRVDNVAVRNGNVQSYRELFSAIFADFHLFEKLYGLFGSDEHVVSELLKKMQLERKVHFRGDRFTTLELSTGQRKRLALIVSILEDRPVYVFDELAADQDPEFRAFLYRELLPELKQRGHTVIAATHDDRYFGVADKVVKMEYGKIEYIRPSVDGQSG